MAWWNDAPYKSGSAGYVVENKRATEYAVHNPGNNLVYDHFTMPADGWVVYFSIQAGRWSDKGVLNAKMCLWHENGERIEQTDYAEWEHAYWPGDGRYYWRSRFWTSAGALAPAAERYKIRKGEGVRLGLLFSPNIPDSYVIGTSKHSNGTHFHRNWNSSESPDGNFFTVKQDSRGNMWGRVTAVENQKPLKGEWRFTAPQGEISTTSPLLEGTIPHPAGDQELDRTQAVHMQIFDSATGAAVYDTYWRDISSTERSQGYFSRTLPAGILEPTKSYQARYRHEDTFAWQSDFSEYTEFSVVAGPGAPGLIEPSGKQDEVAGYSYSGVYSHSQEIQSKAVEIAVYNANGSIKLYSSVFALTLVNSQIFEIPEFHADLAAATGYSWTARAQDANDLWGPWAAKVGFRTNTLPVRPTQMLPSGGRSVSTPEFSCVINDPDVDQITAAELQVLDASTNQTLAGYPAAMTITEDASSGAYQASFTAPTSDFAVGAPYRWRARGADSVGFGPYSEYQDFIVSEAPEVSLLSPSLRARANLIPEPSAEADPGEGGSYWSFEGQSATDHITRESAAPNAAYGEYVWRAVTTTASENSMLGGSHAVDLARDYFVSAELRKLSGVSASHLEVECYDLSDALLGTISPDGVVQGVDVPEFWSPLAGLVYAEGGPAGQSFPAGTASARVRVTPSRASEASVEVDGVQLERMPFGAGAALAARQEAAIWHGYFDGSSRSFAPELGVVYAWHGAEHLSASSGLNVLREMPASALISYASGPGSPKAADRVTVEAWDSRAKAWKILRRGAWVESARTEIPLELGAIQNESRARLAVEVRDSAGATGVAEPVQFDVALAGPPELFIRQVYSDVLEGTISIDFSEPTLFEEEFAAVEVLVEETSSGHGVSHRLSDPSASSFTYHFPVSGVEYRIKVRQIALAGATESEGRWAEALTSCDYAPLCLVKDALSPERSVAFQVTKGEPHSPRRKVGGAEFEPWGRSAPVGYKSAMRYDSGETSIQLFDEDSRGLPSGMERYGELTRMLDEAGTLCLMMQRPEPSKTFVYLPDDYARSHLAPGYPNVSFVWKETEFLEGVEVLEGSGASSGASA